MIVSGGMGKVVSFFDDNGKLLSHYNDTISNDREIYCADQYGSDAVVCSLNDDIFCVNKNGKCLFRGRKEDSADIYSVVSYPNVVRPTHVITASDDRVCRLWKEGKIVKEYKSHTQWIRDVKVIDKDTFISGSQDLKAKVWNIETGEVIREFQGATDWIFQLGYDHTQKVLFVASKDGNIRLYDLRRSEKSSFATYNFSAGFRSICVIPRYQVCLGGTTEDSIGVFDIRKNGKILFNKQEIGHGWIWRIKYMSHKDIILSSGDAHEIGVGYWNFSSSGKLEFEKDIVKSAEKYKGKVLRYSTICGLCSFIDRVEVGMMDPMVIQDLEERKRFLLSKDDNDGDVILYFEVVFGSDERMNIPKVVLLI